MYFSREFLRRIYRIAFLLVLILTIADILVFFYYPGSRLGDIFLATREQTPLTWLSVLAFLFIALSCFGEYFRTRKGIWYFLAVVFFFFSLDDAVYLHERLSGYLADNTDFLSFFPSYIWVVLYLPLLVFALAALVRLMWAKASKKQKRFICIAIGLLVGAIVLDMADGVVQKSDAIVFCMDASCHVAVVHLSRLVEEVFEVMALGILGYAHICIFSTLKEK